MTNTQWKMVIGAIILAVLAGISAYTGIDLATLIKDLGSIDQVIGDM